VNLQQAVNHANDRSRNINLHWFVCKWNDGYIVHSTAHMLRHPDTEYVYSTGDLNRVWEVVFSKEEKRFKHIVKNK
jgi:hypothetical protein